VSKPTPRPRTGLCLCISFGASFDVSPILCSAAGAVGRPTVRTMMLFRELMDWRAEKQR
jgi:hypothetical protein